jgi:inner membrane protein
MTDVQPAGPRGDGMSRVGGSRYSADWGGKALLVCVMAVLMAIPGVFVFGLVMERSHRAEGVISEVSALQGGSQQVLGPLLVAPYDVPAEKGGFKNGGWYIVSAEQGTARAEVKTQSLHRGIFDVPVYDAIVDMQATFAPSLSKIDLSPDARIDWNKARIVVGFSDLRGAKEDVTGSFKDAAGETRVAFAPASGIDIRGVGTQAPQSDPPGGFGLVEAPATMIAVSPSGGTFTVQMRFTGAQRLSVMPFAKSTRVTMTGGWPSPSFDGGFLPDSRRLQAGRFDAAWNVPFIARGLADRGAANALSISLLGAKDLGVTFARANNPYDNVTRALKYAVMFVGLVFLTFFVFEALSGKRLHPAQYLLIGLAQMVFYLLLLSLSEYIGFDIAFACAAVATVGLISLYAGWAFGAGRYRLRALVIFSAVYALIYLLMRLEDFALLAGSIASFVGLSAAMYLTRNIEWYSGRSQPAAQPSVSGQP